MPVAHLGGIRGKEARDLPARGIGQQGVVVGVYAKGIRMGPDVRHGPGQVLQRGVVRRLTADAVAQHKGRVALLVDPLGGGDALAHLGAGVQGVAAHDQHEPGVLPAAREIINFRLLPGGLGSDLLLRVELMGDLDARIVMFDHAVEPCGAVLCGGVVDVLPQGGVGPPADVPGAVLLLIVGVQPGPHHTGVCAQLGHRGVRGDVGFPDGCVCRQSHRRSQGRSGKEVFQFHSRFLLFPQPGRRCILGQRGI